MEKLNCSAVMPSTSMIIIYESTYPLICLTRCYKKTAKYLTNLV